MFNSYKPTFGEPQGEPTDEIVDLEMEILNVHDFKASIEENARAFAEQITLSGLTLSENDKAHLLDMLFNSANENFYEYEDEGIIDSAYEAQDDFLEAAELALVGAGK